ncbi:hypothetical protein DSL72_000221 [Monilinia vaccinii-corymbosi]|uniref:Uncharacterized protein n=1 Tax=Monilinia vaccinii-corymbosi TaxID=61207 RepID=A0A8A3NYP6_9HELO|nr:hypothetical protein DSL72_000221 [Monilinia vaccinii-corymbosi]
MTPPKTIHFQDSEDIAEGWVCTQKSLTGHEDSLVCGYENSGDMYDQNGERKTCKSATAYG